MSILSTSSLEFSTRDRFKMDHDKRGYLVIVDNHKFNNNLCTDLSGSEHAVENLKHAFVNNLGFELVLKQNQTKAQMIDLMKHYAQEVDHTNVDCFMAVFLSHGFANNEKNELVVCAIDECVRLTDLTEPFKACSTLDEKPKIFFCDFCRGGNREPANDQEIPSLSFDDKSIALTNGSKRMSKRRKKFFSETEFLIGFGSCRGFVTGKLLLQYRIGLFF